MDNFTPHPVFAAVWIDGKEARVIELHREDAGFEEHVVHAGHHHTDERHASGRDAHHALWREAFFELVSERLARATDIWLVGPSSTHDALASYLKQRHAAVGARVRGCEPMDHATDRQLADRARRFFEKLEAPRQIFVRN
jgi:hypothetical protein